MNHSGFFILFGDKFETKSGIIKVYWLDDDRAY